MKLLPFILITLLANTYSKSQCNNSVTLCSKRYNEVAFLTTHNSYNSKADGFKLPNQEWNITTQLHYGVRALMLDVYNVSENLFVYHGYKMLGSRPFIDVLNEIKVFMDKNPQEVITIILECYVNSNLIQDEFERSGLANYIYAKPQNEDWKTLRQMIDDNTRLVVFTDRRDAQIGQEWYQYCWDYAVETSFTNHRIKDFTNEFNRGKENADSKELVIFNHFLTTKVTGVGSIRKSKKANSELLDRIQNFQLETGRFPNFITVDFVDIGNAKKAIGQLNATIEISE